LSFCGELKLEMILRTGFLHAGQCMSGLADSGRFSVNRPPQTLVRSGCLAAACLSHPLSNRPQHNNRCICRKEHGTTSIPENHTQECLPTPFQSQPSIYRYLSREDRLYRSPFRPNTSTTRQRKVRLCSAAILGELAPV